ncbi:MAG: PAS domain-containing sensor histidine kinase [Methylobacterium frigidaeris]
MTTLSAPRLRALITAIAELTWFTPPDGRVTDMPEWRAFTGQSLEEVQGWGWLDAVHPEDRAATVTAWNGAVGSRSRYAIEHRVRRRDGIYRWFDARAAPVLGPDGAMVEWAGIHIDVDDRKQAEAATREANDEVQRYAYIVGHDLRAPLVNIMGFSEELATVRREVAAAMVSHPEAARLDGDFAEALGFIRAAVTKMDALIAAILKLSRDGRRHYHPEPLAMAALVQGLADAQRHQADAAGAVVTVGAMPDIRADRLAVQQIFGNLIDNAIKYLDPARAGRITVSGQRRGPWAVYEVADNGRGIAEADHARVFELFRRAGRQDRPGDGIGLAHVRTLVRALDGQITLRSEPGAGTCFEVRLPA